MEYNPHQTPSVEPRLTQGLTAAVRRYVPMFKNNITIQVRPELITFIGGTKSASFQSHLHLDDHSRILSIGVPPPDSGPSIRVALFQEPRLALDYDAALAGFLRHGIRAISNRSFIKPRPTVTFRIAPEVSDFLRGYHRSIFLRAALDAGAMQDSVAFSP